jgi:hypothetical protein
MTGLPLRAQAARFDGVQTGAAEWTYTLTYDPLDNYAVCAPDAVASIVLSGVHGVAFATGPTSTDFESEVLDVVNLAWWPEVSSDGTAVTWRHFGGGTGNFDVPKHVFGFRVFTAAPAPNGVATVTSTGFSIDRPCPVQPADIRDFTQSTDGPGRAAVQVTIDVKPGDLQPATNSVTRGRIAVAILTTELFDAASVDPSTVRFGVTGGEAAPIHAALDDVDRDGDADLVLHFDTQDAAIRCGDESVYLTGTTVDGQAIRGADLIRVVECR